METDCTRRCWATGAVGGLLVWLSVTFVGGHGWLQGLALGLVTTGLLGGLLVWGLCSGAGTAGDNEALLAGGWTDEPFTPSGRVVGAGGETVPPQALPDGGRLPHSAPRDSRTVTPAEGQHAAVASRPAAASGGSGDARTGAPDRARTRIVAGASPDAPVKAQASRSDKGSTTTGQGADRGAGHEQNVGAVPRDVPTGDSDDDAALVEPAPGATGQVARKGEGAVDGMVMDEPALPGDGGEALTLESSGAVSPETDAEAGDEDKLPQGGIVPLAEREEAAGGADAGAGTSVRHNGARAASPEAEAGADEGAAAADDLTRIHGIGPMLQNWLAGYGIERVEQIAAWDDADVARYAGMMGRMGHRIRGEDWVGQARRLAAGEQTAHSTTAATGEEG